MSFLVYSSQFSGLWTSWKHCPYGVQSFDISVASHQPNNKKSWLAIPLRGEGAFQIFGGFVTYIQVWTGCKHCPYRKYSVGAMFLTRPQNIAKLLKYTQGEISTNLPDLGWLAIKFFAGNMP